MSSPPLDPPPFGPALARKCIRITAPIRNYETPREVLILTPVPQSVDEALNADPVEPNDMDRESDVDSDVSETSSSTEDCEDEGGGGQQPLQNQGILEAFLVTDCIHEVRHLYLISVVSTTARAMIFSLSAFFL